MSKTLAQIQTVVRFESRDESIDLSSSELLPLVNLIYRRIGNLGEWAELVRTDTSLTTTAGTNSYTWPSVSFSNVSLIEIQHPDLGMRYESVPAASGEALWAKYRKWENEFPVLYKREHNGTNNLVSFAPTPDVSSLTIRITGVIEPPELTSSGDATIWIQSSMDDAMAYLISADIAAKRGYPQRSQELVARAAEVLGRLAGREITPAELRTGVVEQGVPSA